MILCQSNVHEIGASSKGFFQKLFLCQLYEVSLPFLTFLKMNPSWTLAQLPEENVSSRGSAVTSAIFMQEHPWVELVPHMRLGEPSCTFFWDEVLVF